MLSEISVIQEKIMDATSKPGVTKKARAAKSRAGSGPAAYHPKSAHKAHTQSDELSSLAMAGSGLVMDASGLALRAAAGAVKFGAGTALSVLGAGGLLARDLGKIKPAEQDAVDMMRSINTSVRAAGDKFIRSEREVFSSATGRSKD
jgi:hypothetical protein